MSRPSSSNLHERLYQVAVSHFRQHGYTDTSVSQITREVGVAKGTFFNYFPAKEYVLSEAFHRLADEALAAVEQHRLTGTDAILVFCRVLADGLAADRVLAKALITRLSTLPTPKSTDGLVREEERVREWIESRLSESLPVSVPLTPSDSGLLAFLVTWAFRGTVDEWIRTEAGMDALRLSIRRRVGFLLESAGLPSEEPNLGTAP